MERVTRIDRAKRIMGLNFIGFDELAQIADKLAIKLPAEIPDIPYKQEELENKKDNYLLILGVSKALNGENLSLKSLRDHFGINPDIAEPCFYNQDWYLKEDFFLKPLESKWFLIRKNIFEESRGENPEETKVVNSFPTAVLCAYSFFAFWHVTKKFLWKNDFIWCNDFDSNGDRIYVGRYIDPAGMSKNGFSIHRHLRIRRNYGCIEGL